MQVRAFWIARLILLALMIALVAGLGLGLWLLASVPSADVSPAKVQRAE